MCSSVNGFPNCNHPTTPTLHGCSATGRCPGASSSLPRSAIDSPLRGGSRSQGQRSYIATVMQKKLSVFSGYEDRLFHRWDLGGSVFSLSQHAFSLGTPFSREPASDCSDASAWRLHGIGLDLLMGLCLTVLCEGGSALCTAES